MGKQSTSEEDVRTSVSSIYAQLLSKRKSERALKDEQKRMDRELKEQEKAEKEAESKEPELTKKEKRQKELDAWKEIVIGLTGDDLDYIDDGKKSKKKKKYRRWIDDDDINALMNQEKKKKPKKRNYSKEFSPELNMLRALVTEQNRFTADLQKRFQNAAGPAAKDAMMPNKNLVELASVIASGRSNSLGMIREIGSLKKTIAELYMKQKKLDSETSGAVDFNSSDMGLVGSSIASSMFNDSPFGSVNMNGGTTNATPSPTNVSYSPVYNQGMGPVQSPQVSEPTVTVDAFDPASWDGPDLSNSYSNYENTPHTVMVEKNRETGDMRFVAIKDDGTEFVGCPVPTSDPSKLRVNEQDGVVKGEFDEVYKLRYV